MDQHIYYMRSALAIARQGLGRVWPNPTVGCVLVKNGHVVARSRTADGGRPHAEVIALQGAGENACGATAYVTLEPCAHHGKTPPCAQALIDAGVGEVVIAVSDSDPRVSGRGVRMLQEAGIHVVEGVCEAEARQLNTGFFSCVEDRSPFVTLKTATTFDSKIATKTGNSQWITGDLARKRGHLLRAQHDAIAVGVNTVLSDNPSLTTRLDGVNHSIVRIVFDTDLKISGDEMLFNDIDKNPVWVFTGNPTGHDRLVDKGVRVIVVEKEKGRVSISSTLKALADEGITRLLVEGGATLITSFIAQGLFDQLYWFRNDSIIGGDGLNAIAGLGVKELTDKVQLKLDNEYRLGSDRLQIYSRLS